MFDSSVSKRKSNIENENNTDYNLKNNEKMEDV